MQTQVRKWGNSLAVRIPGSCARDLELKEGMKLDVAVIEGAILLRPRRAVYTLNELVSPITPENLHGETDWGKPLGGESW
jgi:antitoxin MazE